MGWRDINMNRRRPQPRFAVVLTEPGMDRPVAVLRKAAANAVRALKDQLSETAVAEVDTLRAFVAGYILGYARQAAMKDGVDCEAAESSGSLADLLRELAAALPSEWAIETHKIGFSPRQTFSPAPRTRFYAVIQDSHAMCDAGYLVGHLEALCGSRKLARIAHERIMRGGPNAGVDYLTDCDVAADPMQTRSPTLSLRFDEAERKVIVEAFGDSRPGTGPVDEQAR